MTSEELKLSQIMIDGGTQPRAKLDFRIIAEFARAMGEGTQFPPVVVFFDGAKYWLADGFHRTRAAIDAGLKVIAAEVLQGDRRDAILYGIQVNSEANSHRTRTDKRFVVLKLLKDPEWSRWSDGEIARRCGVSTSYVHNLRKQLVAENGFIQEQRAITNPPIGLLEGDASLFNIVDIRQEQLFAEDNDEELALWNEEQLALVSTDRCIIIDPYISSPDVLAKAIERLKSYYKRKTGKDYV